MPIRLVSTCSLFVAVSLMGCSRSDPQLSNQISQLRSQLRDLEQSATVFDQKIEGALRRMGTLDTDMSTIKDSDSSLKLAWQQFKTDNSSEARTQLEQNRAECARLLDDLKKAHESATNVGPLLQKLVDEAKQLTELCQKHANEAKDANQVGILRSSITKCEQSLQNLEGEIRSLQSNGMNSKSQLETRIWNIESKFRSLETKINSMPFRR